MAGPVQADVLVLMTMYMPPLRKQFPDRYDNLFTYPANRDKIRHDFKKNRNVHNA